ncbi:type I-E CRISPR-associated protein Cas5/CasD [Vreelandella subglaciescola]|jgi:CRISPR system Cascade subunit CasD|uniref:CRISPR-associated protein, Cas5e family n=1 Tax=Vreelandella subglaciescola TaxID=29571 RepID=A0A1M7GL83_9GAMM|nr:type I-E CRISPR-associated protein Cas5/CasD [Halomonas subglaciescola]SHM16936.1 CRISPR-associated protein, Cas5e family [Halomonas subglaciescola]
MTEYLVFRLYAPLASWGEAAVGETRPTATYPGKSALLGLLGAALGIRREDDAGQKALGESLAVAVKQRSEGTLMRDYHTVQAPQSRAKVSYSTRKAELSAPKSDLTTILSSRDYRCDGLWTVAFWLTPGANWTLAELKQALETPHFCLYLGRKACPPAAPLAPEVVTCSTLKEALDSGFPPLNGRNDAGEKALRLSGQVLYAWEGSIDQLDGSAVGVEYNDVWDLPLNRRRWQFGPRLECRRVMQDKESR